MRSYRPVMHSLRRILLTLAAALLVAHSALAQTVTLKPGYPERYTVVEGDTLWDIANRYLDSPWQWPKIWRLNEKIENPHLIYPGDVLVMTMSQGEPQLQLLRRETVKVSPSVREESLREAIPTVPPNAIMPFLTAPLVIEEGALDGAPYVTRSVNEAVMMGRGQRFYGRGFSDPDQEQYQIFRPGLPFVDPDSAEVLGHEAVFLGSAQLIRYGDPAKLEIVSSKEEIGPGDRLQPLSPDVRLPTYFPRAPDGPVRGRILRTVRGVAEVGPYDIVAISLGRREGIEEGHVLRVMRYVGTDQDPVTGEQYEIPDESTGLLMVFRPFEKVSYALVLNAERAIHLRDVVVTP